MQQFNGLSLIIDTNHTWQAESLNIQSRLLLPTTKGSYLDVLFSLPLYNSPHLQTIIIDSLPSFFRDAGINTFRNAREYALSLSLLKRMTNIRLIATTHSSGLNPEIPILPEITKYYADHLVHVRSTDPFDFDIDA
jgi:hypothetical protein